MKIGIYGGTFSPPHIGHVLSAEAFYREMKLDKLYIIPAGIPPHKSIDYPDDPEKRLRLCELSFSDIPNTEVSDIELKREGKSYTVLTLRELTQKGRELFLLCGTDMILTLDSWYCPDEIFRLCTPVCVRRESDVETGQRLREKLELYRERYGVDVPIIDLPVTEISSSEIRDRIGRGESVSGLVTPAAEEFILTEGMYR